MESEEPFQGIETTPRKVMGVECLGEYFKESSLVNSTRGAHFGEKGQHHGQQQAPRARAGEGTAGSTRDSASAARSGPRGGLIS